MGQDYVRTARAKGLNNRTVVVRHAFRNALIPLATLMAFDFAAIFSGAIITETVFGWSGLGKLFTTSLTNIDPNPVMAFFLVSATAIVLFNMLADICVRLPRPTYPIGVMMAQDFDSDIERVPPPNVPATELEMASFVGVDNELAESGHRPDTDPAGRRQDRVPDRRAGASSGTRRPGPASS